MKPAAQFIAAINAHDPEALARLMTADHLFVDPEGNEHRGSEPMRDAWRVTFEWFPDYLVDVERSVAVDESTAFFGWASGTYSENGRSWRLPAAWLAVERDGLVSEWHVYCDAKLPSEILGS